MIVADCCSLFFEQNEKVFQKKSLHSAAFASSSSKNLSSRSRCVKSKYSVQKQMINEKKQKKRGEVKIPELKACHQRSRHGLLHLHQRLRECGVCAWGKLSVNNGLDNFW